MTVVSEFTLHTQRLVIRQIRTDDAELIRAYSVRNRERLRPWEPLRDDAFYGEDETRLRVHGMEKLMREGSALHLALFRDDALIGLCNFTNIVRGPFEACHLGFSLDGDEEGKGLMHEALLHVLAAVFERMKLHRVMANYRPDNRRSAELLERLGFEIEGYAKSYLKINGEWSDHVLTSLLCDKCAPQV